MKLKWTIIAGLIFGLFIGGNIEITDGLVAESAFIAEATEIIGVVRIGVSLVEYIYKGTEVEKKLSQRLYIQKVVLISKHVSTQIFKLFPAKI